MEFAFSPATVFDSDGRAIGARGCSGTGGPVGKLIETPETAARRRKEIRHALERMRQDIDGLYREYAALAPLAGDTPEPPDDEWRFAQGVTGAVGAG